MESIAQKKYRQSEKGKAYIRKYQKKWAREHYDPTKQRNANLKMNRGIDTNQFNQMFAAQDGKCPICGKLFEDDKGRGVHVDHDHETGKIRDLLCNHCNFLIGHARENVQTLINAIAYLEKWQLAAERI